MEKEIRLQDHRLDKIIAACGGKKYEGEDYVEEKLEENGILKDDDRKEDGSDVLKDYGFGIVAYFGILFSLFLIFCVISIFSLALIFLYKKEGALDSSIAQGFKPKLSLYSMGNLGISDTKCYSWFYNLREREQTFSCSK